MKNLLLLVGMLLVIASCGPNYKQQVIDLKLRQDSLMTAYNLKEDELVTYMKDLNEIQNNISELTQQEQLLQKTSEGELNANAKTKILNDLEAIRTALQSNKKKLASVQSRLKKSNAKITELESMIVTLNRDLALRDSSISLLTQTVSELRNKIDIVQTDMVTIKTDNETKSKEIADKTNKLNTAYYTVGSYKSLREKQVISNEGKIFKSKEINPNYSTDSFTKVDITSTKEIVIDKAKEIKFASIHPIDSYALTKENDRITSIQVTNPDRFWSSSRHLIVITN